MATLSTRTERETHNPGWTTLAGKILDGGFELQEILEADDAHARMKVRVLGDRDLDAVATFYRLAADEADEQVAIWNWLRSLRHPNLSTPLGSGQLSLQGAAAAYLVTRRADESLGTVLSERPLSSGEAGEALESITEGLQVLHLNGLVHGTLQPLHVLAVGDSIQISTESLRPAGKLPATDTDWGKYHAPESEFQNTTVEADLWCMGATLFEALTQRTWMEEQREEIAALPEPFSSIASRCLHPEPAGRASLSEVIALYRGEIKIDRTTRTAPSALPAMVFVEEPVFEHAVPPPEPAEVRVENSMDSSAASDTNLQPSQAALSSPASSQSAPASPLNPLQGTMPEENASTLHSALPSSVPVPSIAPPAPSMTPRSSFEAAITRPNPVLRRGREATRRPMPDDEDEPATHMWIWAGVALLALLGLIWALRPKTAGPVKQTPAAADSRLTPHPKGDNNAWQTRTLQPDGSASHSVALPTDRTTAKAIAGDKVKSQASASSTGPWRVILFTYTRLEDAQNKVKSLNAKHSILRAEIFSPSGSGSPYLVSVGGRMTREGALQVRRQAVNLGMPRDSYIQNYTR